MNQTMPKRTKTIQEIKNLLNTLYFIESEIADNIRDNLQNLPEQGLLELLSTLKKGEEKQQKMLLKLTDANKDLPKELKKFIQNNYQELAKKATKQEQSTAEQILHQI